MAVRGSETILKCNECDEYFSIDKGFWPPNYQVTAVCPCGAEAKWKWKSTDPRKAPSPSISWRQPPEKIKEAPKGDA